MKLFIKALLLACVVLISAGRTVSQINTREFKGTSETDDVKLSSYSADKNYGIQEDLYFRGDKINTLIRCCDIRNTLGTGKEVTVCSLYIYISSMSSSVNLSAYRVFKNWIEGDENGVDNDDGDATWNDWQSDAYEWHSAGCEYADDAGYDNNGDGAGADRKATAEYTKALTYPDDQNGYVAFDLTSICQDWYNETIENNGVLLKSDTDVNTVASSSENIGEDRQPYFVIKYASLPVENIRRRQLLSNHIKGE